METKNIYSKLLRVQTALKAPKSQYNDFGKYAYRTCEDILEALKPILAEEKALVILKDQIAMIGERYYIQAEAAFIDCETGSTVTNYAFAREEETKKGMDGSQVTGASSSYARKYALNGLFAIDDNKDSDTTNTHGKKPKKELEKEPLDETLVKTFESLGGTLEVAAQYLKISVDDLTNEHIKELIASKKRNLAKAGKSGGANE